MANGRLTSWQKFWLSLPTMPQNLSGVLIHNAFMKYYTDVIGVDPWLVGVIYMVFGIWNAVNDPAIGVLLDRYRYRPGKGKYVYVMKRTAPAAVFASFAMIFAQSGWNEWLTFAFLLALLFVYDTAMTAFGIAYANYRLIAAPQSEDRVDISVYISYIANIGGFFGTIIATQLLVGNGDKSLTTLLFAGVLILNAALYYLALRPLKDAQEMYLQENAQISARKGVYGDVFDGVRDLAKSQSFVTYMLNQILAAGPRAFYFTPMLYMADNVLKLSGNQTTAMDVTMGLVLFAAMPLFGKLTKRLGLKGMTLWSTVPCAFAYLALTFVRDFPTALIAYIAMYLFSSAVLIPQGPLLGAIIDEDEMRTGRRKAGLFNGISALLTVPVHGIQSSIFMGILGAYGYQAGADAVQSARALLGIRIGAGVLPFAFMLASIVPLLLFPIDKKREAELSRFSRERQLEAEAGGSAE